MDEGDYAPTKLLAVAKFADPRTEEAFLAAYRSQGIHFAAIGLALGAMLAILVACSLIALDQDGHRAVVRGWSYIGLSLVLGTASWLAFAHPKFVIRHYPYAIGFPVIASITLLCTFWWMRIEQDAAPYTHGVTVMILALFVIAAFGRLPTTLVSCLAGGSGVSYIVAMVTLSEPLLPASIYVLLAGIAAIALGFDIEKRERAVFRQLSLTNAASTAKSRVLASVSHDLRQPLGALALYLGSLKQRSGAVDAADLLHSVERMDLCLQAMDGNLSRLLEIGRLQGEAQAVELESVDLRDLTQRLQFVYALQAANARVKLEVDHLDSDARWGLTNKSRLFEILSNLVHNAIKFTVARWPSGGGAIRIALNRDVDTICVRVEDNGPGIAPQDHARIFQEYVQIGNSERDHRKGYGLGLAVVRQMVGSLSGHTVSVNSVIGMGARFEVSLGIGTADAAAKSLGERAALEDVADGADLVGRLVIVVEDDVLVRDALILTLNAWGVEVDLAGSAVEARDMAASSDLLYDAILTDWRLPLEQTGRHVIDLVRDACGLPIPAIVVTGELLDDNLPLDMPSDVTLLRKPLGWSALQSALREAFARADMIRTLEDELA